MNRSTPYLSDAIRFIILAFFALYFIMPIYLLAITSFKPFEDISFNTMWALPKGFYLNGITQAWSYVSQNFMNSIIVTLPASLLSSILGSFNGYLFAKWRFPGSRWLFLMVLFGIFLPYQGILIPLVQVLGALDLYGKYAGLIIVHIVFGIPITTLIFRGYYSAVPDELVDAARIDGAGVLGVFRHIMLPLAMPAFGVSMIWQFTSIWNDYLIGLVILSNPDMRTVMVAVKNLTGSFFTNYGAQMAAALIAASPTIIIYLLLSRLFHRGLLAGSVKG